MEILLKLVGYVTVDRVSCHHSRGAWEIKGMIHIPANSHACRLKTSISRRLTLAGQFLTPD